jgi:hypothetical protein
VETKVGANDYDRRVDTSLIDAGIVAPVAA